MALFVDGDVEDIDFVVDFVVDVFFLLLEVLLVVPRLAVLELLQSGLQRCVLLGHFVDDFQQLFDFKSFLGLRLDGMGIQLSLEAIYFLFLLTDDLIFHLRYTGNTFSILMFSFLRD